jgi:hypothetical protein
MTQIASKFLLTPMTIWVAPVGTAPPATSVLPGAAWGGAWTKFGYSKEALKLSYKFDKMAIEVEDLPAPIAFRKTKEELMIEAVLAEFDLNQLKHAFDGTYTLNLAPTSSVAGLEELTVGGKFCITEQAWGLEGTYQDDECANSWPVRVFIWRASADGGTEQTFGKKDYTGTPLKLAALADPGKAGQLIKFQKVIAPTAE